MKMKYEMLCSFLVLRWKTRIFLQYFGFFDHFSLLHIYKSLIIIQSENHAFGCLTNSINA